MVYTFFDKKSTSLAQSHTSATQARRDKSASSGGIKSENMQNQELAEELHKPIIIKINKWKIHLAFIENIWVLILLICNS